jgi:REP element-mobilizing transposase RayT
VKTRRNSRRLKGRDCSTSGFYFVTFCAHERASILGAVTLGEVRLSAGGEALREVILALPLHHPHLVLDEWVIMPNHVHLVLGITASSLTASAPPPGEGSPPARNGISEIVRGLKTFSARAINLHRQTPGAPVWQRGFHDRIVRGKTALEAIRHYIRRNPAVWQTDLLNPTIVCLGDTAPTHEDNLIDRELLAVLGEEDEEGQ